MYNHQLDTFIQVAEVGSFSKAAAALYITPTAVIKQMNLLEATVGVPLFVRTHRGLTLTAAGQSLYADARHLVQYAQESIERARAADASEQRVIRVGSSPMTPSAFMANLWPRVRKHCQGTAIKLVPYENTPQNARRILANLGEDIDIVAGVFDEAFLRSRKCDALEISREPLRCALSASHPLANRPRLSLADLSKQNLLLMQRGWNGDVDALRDELWEKHPEITIEDFAFYSIEVFNRCEASGKLLMTIDPWVDVHPLLVTKEVEWDCKVSYGILHSPHPSAHVQALLDAVAQELNLA